MEKSSSVFYSIGPGLVLKTKGQKARLSINGSSITLAGKGEQLYLSGQQFRSITLARPHKVGTVIKIDIGNEYLFLAVRRLALGQFVIINYVSTMRLFEQLSAISAGPSTTSGIKPRYSRARKRLVLWSVALAIVFVAVALKAVSNG
ncbi:hypothetical protein [Agrobacterium cavarae]|uniref:hypothetical protein n=1 Tax=Agrobacterium cavarae TaxID=2528239 RepID=UPI002FD8C940